MRAGACAIIIADLGEFGELEREIVAGAREADKSAPQVSLLNLDITNREAVETAAKNVAAEFGKLDILINNAGRFEQYLPLLESKPDSYWKTWEFNIGGTINVTRYFLPLLLQTKDGLNSIINVSSAGALTVRPGASAYRTINMELLRWTEFLDCDYREQGILAYCVHPGGLLTALGSGMPQEEHANKSAEL